MTFYARGFGPLDRNGTAQGQADEGTRVVAAEISDCVARNVLERLEDAGFIKPDLDDQYSLWLHDVKTGWRPIHLAPSQKLVLLRLNPKARDQYGYNITIGTFNSREDAWWCPGIGQYSADPIGWLPLPPWMVD